MRHFREIYGNLEHRRCCLPNTASLPIGCYGYKYHCKGSAVQASRCLANMIGSLREIHSASLRSYNALSLPDKNKPSFPGLGTHGALPSRLCLVDLYTLWGLQLWSHDFIFSPFAITVITRHHGHHHAKYFIPLISSLGAADQIQAFAI
jgi:hypothetical protein